MIAKLKVLLQIAFRNLFLSPMNIIVGLIILSGVFFIVMIASVLESMDAAMSKSIVGSVAGDVQVYSGNSKEQLALFGSMMGTDPDLAVFDDFSKLEEVIQKLPNVERVVPMGTGGALITSGNTIDLTLADLREAVNKRKDAGASPELDAQIASQKDHVRQLIKVLKQDRERTKEISSRAVEPEVTAAIERTSSDAFWAEFDKAPFDALELLENRIAPLVTDADMLNMRYVGTDFARFRKAFPTMELVQGGFVPEGRRGLMIPEFFYEEFLKLKTARRLDKIKDAREQGRTLAKDPELRRFVKENQTQVREIIFQLDRLKTEQLARAVTAYLVKEAPSQLAAHKEALKKSLTGNAKRDENATHDLAAAEADEQAIQELAKQPDPANVPLAKLLPVFFNTWDSNFDGRYAFFYKEFAPLLELYRVRVGDIFTIKAFTKSGYVQAVNLKVYGIFKYRSLEKSPLAGFLSLMDLVSFRELYGHLTTEKAAELKALKAKAGVKDVSRENAEAELFGGGEKTVVAEATPGVINEDLELGGVENAFKRQDLINRVYGQEEMDQGVVLNAAVILKDPSKSRQAMQDIEKAGEAAGLKLKAVSWYQASGLFGQFVVFAKLGLYVAVLVMFVVALAVIILAMIIATMQRVSQIGTLRAIGAQRSFVLGMILTETVVVGIVFGLLGLFLGAGAVGGIAQKGIPAPSERLYFFFAGPRLFPTVSPSILIAAFVVILLTCTLSALYPALLATRVSPLRAMQTDE